MVLKTKVSQMATEFFSYLAILIVLVKPSLFITYAEIDMHSYLAILDRWLAYQRLTFSYFTFIVTVPAG